jgi:hypothetical protein
MYVDHPSGNHPKDLVDLEGSMGHDGDAGRDLALAGSANGSFYSHLHFLGPGTPASTGSRIGLSAAARFSDSHFGL